MGCLFGSESNIGELIFYLVRIAKFFRLRIALE